MIPHRIIHHLKSLHWTSRCIDLAIVVVGVFIGLQVNNGNHARVQRIASLRA